MRSFKVFFILFSIWTHAVAAGVGHSGGGDVLICKEQFVFSKGIQEDKVVYLADTYDLFKDTSVMLRRLNIDNPEVLNESIAQFLEEKDAIMFQKLNKALANLKFEFVENKRTLLEEVEDDNIQYEGHEACSKGQLAVQYFSDSGINNVKVQKTYHWYLSPLEKELFRWHEAYISLYPDKYDRSFVRDLVKSIVDNPRFETILWNNIYASNKKANPKSNKNLYKSAFTSVLLEKINCFNHQDIKSINFYFVRLFSFYKEFLEISFYDDFYQGECENVKKTNFDISALIRIYSQIDACRLNSEEIKQFRYKQATKLRNNFPREGNRNSSNATLETLAVSLGKILCPLN